MTDREKLIELIDQSRITRTEHSVCINGSAHMADFLIANGVTFATDTNVGSKWVPVSERLPDWKDGKVLICTRYGISVAERTVNGRWQGQHATPKLITHWMPLPEPPKEE